MILFASETAPETVLGLPSYFPTMLLALVLVFALVMCLFMVAWRVIDKITPGKLNDELLGKGRTQPNLALAIVVASMVLGMSIILGLTVLGVLVH